MALDEIERAELTAGPYAAYIGKCMECEELITRLTESRSRTLLRMYFIDGYCMPEIANALELSEGTCYRIYRKALNSLEEVNALSRCCRGDRGTEKSLKLSSGNRNSPEENEIF